MLYYPDFNKKFEIHTDSSNYQMGAIISQGGDQLHVGSRKSPRINKSPPPPYSSSSNVSNNTRRCASEKNIVVWKNLTYKNTEHDSDRVIRQRLLLEEYTVKLKFIQGIKNEAVDMLSRNYLVYESTKKVSNEKNQGNSTRNTYQRNFSTSRLRYHLSTSKR